MSIPPLVCSTPPPPEQCEDDKDHEDFDLTYNLSQEDDDDSVDYNYGNYSSYNIYSTKSENTDKDKWTSNCKDITESKKEVTTKSEEIINCVNLIPNHNLFTDNYTKCEENTLEDLNLKVDQEIVHSSKISTEEYETETHIYVTEETSDKDRIQDEGGTDILRVEDEFITISDDNVIDTVCENINMGDEIIDTNDLSETSLQVKFNKNDVECEKIDPLQNVILEDEPEISENINVVKDFDVYSEKDDFGDFEDFQFKNASESQTTPVSEIPENPWGNDSKSSQFGAFTAHFDSKPLKTVNDNTIKNADEDDDDFGDFDDFKSSTNTDTLKMSKDVEIMLTSATNVPALGLQSPESEIQIVDSINNVLTSIFTVEVSELEVNVDKNLESYLSETWGHLIDIDVRQPYMVNWNNSLGQKTLLKALCIDSRNILFGPKWNYNMPKYAVNLTAAPLQPQKQTTQSYISTTETTEKVLSKEAGTWIDPFTPDRREYTYAEALLLDLEHLMATLDQMAHKHSTLKISELLSHACNTENENAKSDTLKRSSETDVLGDETSSKSNKIYSSTINVQPLRHINLPDTHIFTPTDSETPRSKTIHYDSAPAVVPPLEAETGKNKIQVQVLQSSTVSESENEYWDFQDFKGTTNDILSTKSINPTDVQETLNNANTGDTLPTSSITYQTQILQPIKLEPIMPTLNWPDPGEVKETFDDFSDFIMSTSRNNEREMSLVDTKKDEVLKVEVDTDLASKTENIDDEFETFQSAPMTKPAEICDNLHFNFESINTKVVGKKPLNTSSPILSNYISGLQDFNLPRSSGVISVNHVGDNILQPSNSTTGGISRTHNTGQILQPLSLESYSQINWPNPGIDLQDLSRFNPVNSVHSLKSDSIGTNSKGASPAHNSVNNHEVSDDDIWGDFVSSAPKPQSSPKKPVTFADDDEWTDFVSSPNIKPLNGLNTISLNVHTNQSMQKSSTQNKIASRSNQMPLDIPTLNYITPKSNNRGMYSEPHFQNL